MALGWFKDRRAVTPLTRLLTDADASVRSSVVQALGELGDRSVVPQVMALASDKDEWVRIRVARSLGVLGDTQAIPVLIDLLDDKQEWVRFNATWSLGTLKATTAMKPLIRMLNLDPNPNVRRGAAEALGRMGDDTVVEHLVACLTDESDMVLEAIDQALQRLGYAVE